MAALTENTAGYPENFRQLASVAIVDQTAASTAVTRFIRCPPGARYCTWFLYVDVVDGTTPKLDFVVRTPDAYGFPDGGTLFGIGEWDGITQITSAASPFLVTIDIGPGVTGIANDDTGSASASCHYSINAELPPVLAYTYTTQDAADDADYSFRLAVNFR